MRGIICYDTKYGSTKSVCESIKRGMGISVDIENVSEVNNLDYDIIIVGSPIFIGKPMKSVSDFLVQQQKALEGKNMAAFVTCWATATKYSESSSEFIEQLLKYLPCCNLLFSESLPGRLLLDEISIRDRGIMERLLRRLDQMSEEFNSKEIEWRDARNAEIAENFGRQLMDRLVGLNGRRDSKKAYKGGLYDNKL